MMPQSNNRFTDNVLALVEVNNYGVTVLGPTENWKLVGGVFLTYLFQQSHAYQLTSAITSLYFAGLTASIVNSDMAASSANWAIIYENEKAIAGQLNLEWTRENSQPELPGTAIAKVETPTEAKVPIDPSIPLTWAIFANDAQLKDPEKIEDNWRVVRDEYISLFEYEENRIKGSTVKCLYSNIEFDKTVRSLEEVLQNEKDLTTILFLSLGWKLAEEIPQQDYEKGAIPLVSASKDVWYKICNQDDKAYLTSFAENGLIIPFDFEAEQTSAKERIKEYNRPKLGNWWISIENTVNFSSASFLSEWCLVEASFAEKKMKGLTLEETVLETGQKLLKSKIGTKEIGFLEALPNIPEVTNEDKVVNEKTVDEEIEKAKKPAVTHNSYTGWNNTTTYAGGYTGRNDISIQASELKPESWAWCSTFSIRKHPNYMLSSTSYLFNVNEVLPSLGIGFRTVLAFKNKAGLVYLVCFDSDEWKLSEWNDHWDKMDQMINPVSLYGYYDKEWHAPPHKVIKWLPKAIKDLIKTKGIVINTNHVISVRMGDDPASMLFNVTKEFAEKIFDPAKMEHELVLIPQTEFKLTVKKEQVAKSKYDQETGEKSLLQYLFQNLGFDTGWVRQKFILKDIHNRYFHCDKNPLHFDTICWLVDKTLINSLNVEEPKSDVSELLTVAQLQKGVIGYTLKKNIVQFNNFFWVEEDGIVFKYNPSDDYIQIEKDESGYTVTSALNINYEKVPVLANNHRKINSMSWVSAKSTETPVLEECCTLLITEDIPYKCHLNVQLSKDLAEEIRDSLSVAGKMPGYAGPLNISVKEVYEYEDPEKLEADKKKLLYFFMDSFLWTKQGDPEYSSIAEGFNEIEDFEGVRWRRTRVSSNTTTNWLKDIKLIHDIPMLEKKQYKCRGIWLQKNNLYYYTITEDFANKFHPSHKLEELYEIPNSNNNYRIVHGATVYSKSLCDDVKFRTAVLEILDWEVLTGEAQPGIVLAGCEEVLYFKNKKHTTVDELEWIVKSHIVNFISDENVVVTAENISEVEFTEEDEIIEGFESIIDDAESITYEVIPSEDSLDPFISNPKPHTN